MKDITTILVHYDDQDALNRALSSLQTIDSRLASVFIFKEKEMTFKNVDIDHCLEQVQWVTVEYDFGKTLNDTIQKINSSYVLFLQHNDYLNPDIQAASLQK